MSIRSVDLQSVLQRASESQRTNAINRGQPNPEQHHFLQELQQQTERSQQMVLQMEQPEANRLQSDGRRNQRNPENKHERRRQKQESTTWLQDKTRGTHLDIKV
ncbi:MAG: hypothetical protein GX060_06500 [Firmicutes bacterium]|jgi:hypothetical protein|nr:hypothetical protein [Bacillota bacterium]